MGFFLNFFLRNLKTSQNILSFINFMIFLLLIFLWFFFMEKSCNQKYEKESSHFNFLNLILLWRNKCKDSFLLLKFYFFLDLFKHDFFWRWVGDQSKIDLRNFQLKNLVFKKFKKSFQKTPIKCSKRNMIIKSNYFEKSWEKHFCRIKKWRKIFFKRIFLFKLSFSKMFFLESFE